MSETTGVVVAGVEVQAVVLTLPVGAASGGHVSRYVAARLSPCQGRGLKRLVAALDAVGAVEGKAQRRVTNGAGAVRWLLEQYGLTMAAEDASQKL